VVTTSMDDDFDDFQGPSTPLPSPAVAQPVRPESPSSQGSAVRAGGAATAGDAAKKKKSIEEMIALVAHDPLNTHAPSLKQWQTSHSGSGPPHAQPQPPVQNEVDLLVLDDDAHGAGGFSAAGTRKANTAMSAFDAMADLDVQASNEDWDDFADETTAPPAPVVIAKVESDNPFDQFLAPEETAAPLEVTSVPAPVAEDEDFGDFGGFEEAPAANILSHAVGDFESFESSPAIGFAASFDNEPPIQTDPAVSNDDDDFGDFAEHTGGSSDMLDMGSAEIAAPAFAASFGGASFLHGDTTGEIDQGSDDEFGDFSTTETAAVDTPTPVEPQRFDSSDVRDIPVKVSEDDDDFGDFATTGVSSMPEPGCEDVPREDEFDDFNDFEEAASPAAPAADSTGDSVDFFGDAFGELGDTQNAPVPVLEGFSFTPPKPSEKPVTARQLSAADLLDSVLLDTSLYASPPSNPVQAAPAPVVAAPSTSSGGGSFLDEFMPKPAPVSVRPAPAASGGGSSFLLDFESFSKQLPEVVDRSLTLDELETLFSVLMDLNRFAEAYGVGQQGEAVRKIKELGNKKMQAVENDDLELAIQLRDEINRVKESELVASRDDERYWLEMAHSGKKNNSIEDYIELVGSIDPDCVDVIRSKYISAAPDNASSNCDRALFYANALRALQLVVAVRTSHRDHVDHWGTVMTKVSRILLDSLGSIEEFKGLAQTDRDVLVGTEQMNVFVRGVLRVVDVGKWIAASCQEAVVETSTAGRTASLCDSVVEALTGCGLLELESNVSDYKGVAPILSNFICAWLYAQYRNMSLQELCFASSRLMGLMGRKEAHFCSLTLRPVSVSPSTG
jgi:hypothetical protein